MSNSKKTVLEIAARQALLLNPDTLEFNESDLDFQVVFAVDQQEKNGCFGSSFSCTAKAAV